MGEAYSATGLWEVRADEGSLGNRGNSDTVIFLGAGRWTADFNSVALRGTENLTIAAWIICDGVQVAGDESADGHVRLEWIQ